jgi:hypothetical protein
MRWNASVLPVPSAALSGPALAEEMMIAEAMPSIFRQRYVCKNQFVEKILCCSNIMTSNTK